VAPDLLSDGFGFEVPVEDGYLGPGPGERDRDGPVDSGGSTGHECTSADQRPRIILLSS
jgi:hypothetical protein